MYGIDNEVKFPEVPASFSSRPEKWGEHSFFFSHLYDHLVAIFVPSIDLEDVIAHIEALNDSHQSLSLRNTEMTVMRKAVPQNRMELDFITASQGSPCAIIQTQCCVFILD